MHSRISRGVAGCLAAAALFAGAAAQAHDVVVNGGFETGDFSGWSNTGDPSWSGVDGNAPQSGTYGAYLGTIVPGTKTLSQTLNTTVGEFYDVIFWLQNEADVQGDTAPNSFVFSWGGADQLTLTDAAAFGYTKYEYNLQASAATTTIQFTYSQLPAYWDLDNVAVIPEPSSLALAGLAVGLAVAQRRRRKFG
jgi:hypothetical protein